MSTKNTTSEQGVEMVCISCPIGCRLTVKLEGETVTVAGNKCPRGEVYGTEEMLSPRRVVTATVATGSPSIPRLPVRTTGALPKENIDELLNRAYRLTVAPPVTKGQVIIRDIMGTGIDLVSSRDIAAPED